jgi:hypothetical protein
MVDVGGYGVGCLAPAIAAPGLFNLGCYERLQGRVSDAVDTDVPIVNWVGALIPILIHLHG